LVTIVARKAVNRFKKDRALKRGGAHYGCGQPGQERNGTERSLAEILAGDPTPDTLAELNEELHYRLSLLTGEMLRDIAILRLHGFTNREIAQRIGVAERTVRRKIYCIRREWTDTLD
jgi:DNA-directed RNA polymerase specialized sigma24 family protein